ncbi:MAG: hypothetical protein M3133_01385, partial [Actinomycetota bacterium]|nr:hypothetical protein [Actinomycetota bacterium]
MVALRDKRLLFVTGKGGAGKTTVAAALGLSAARRGRRTIVCELAGQERVPRALGRTAPAPGGHEEVQLAPGLHWISLDPQLALAEYLRAKTGSRTLYRLLFDNRVFQYLAAVTPGLAEILT